MSEIQRWDVTTDYGFRSGEAFGTVELGGSGQFVTHADHVAVLTERDRLFAKTLAAIRRVHEDHLTAAVADAEQRGMVRAAPDRAYDIGVSDERERIRKAVMNLPVFGRLAGTDSTFAALHVLAVINEEKP